MNIYSNNKLCQLEMHKLSIFILFSVLREVLSQQPSGRRLLRIGPYTITDNSLHYLNTTLSDEVCLLPIKYKKRDWKIKCLWMLLNSNISNIFDDKSIPSENKGSNKKGHKHRANNFCFVQKTYVRYRTQSKQKLLVWEGECVSH